MVVVACISTVSNFCYSLAFSYNLVGIKINKRKDSMEVETQMTNTKEPRQIQVGDHSILVDDEDYQFLSRFTWSVRKDKNTLYAQTNIFVSGRNINISMHRMITTLKKSQVDHRNRNGLDNRKENLRFATNQQNSCNRVRYNRFGYRGVYQTKKSQYFSFQIQLGKKRIQKHGFKTPEDAARGYDKLSKELHGKFGIRNFKD